MIEEPAQINSSNLKKIDSLQKIPGWISDNLRPLIHELGLKDKVMEFNKSFAREHILETLQELLLWDEIVSKNQEVILPNQSVYSLSANFENFISRERVVKQLDSEEVMSSPQVIPLASVTVP
ncbi:2581_t:CDS:1, partial [Dentiscutata heterogama]